MQLRSKSLLHISIFQGLKKVENHIVQKNELSQGKIMTNVKRKNKHDQKVKRVLKNIYQDNS